MTALLNQICITAVDQIRRAQGTVNRLKTARFETERRHLEAMSQAAQQRSDARLRAAERCRKVNVSTLTFLHRSNCPNLSLRCVGPEPGCTRRPSARPALSEVQVTRRLRSRQIFQQPATESCEEPARTAGMSQERRECHGPPRPMSRQERLERRRDQRRQEP